MRKFYITIIFMATLLTIALIAVSFGFDMEMRMGARPVSTGGSGDKVFWDSSGDAVLWDATADKVLWD